MEKILGSIPGQGSLYPFEWAPVGFLSIVQRHVRWVNWRRSSFIPNECWDRLQDLPRTLVGIRSLKNGKRKKARKSNFYLQTLKKQPPAHPGPRLTQHWQTVRRQKCVKWTQLNLNWGTFKNLPIWPGSVLYTAVSGRRGEAKPPTDGEELARRGSPCPLGTSFPLM